jgi:hypothetical protein
MKIFYFLFIITILFSCETVLDEIPESSLPRSEEKLVIASFISPQDTVVVVRVTVSTPLYATYLNTNRSLTDTSAISNVVRNAKVTLSTDNQSVTLNFDSKNGWYQIPQKDFKIIAGRTYKLKAETTDKSVEATCTVPEDQVKIDSYKVDSLLEPDFDHYHEGFKYTLKWTDVKGKTNQYRVRANLEYEISIRNQSGANTTQITYANTTWNDENNSISAYLDDKNVDGNQFGSPTGKSYTSSHGRNAPTKTNKPPTLILELLNIDPNYADYHKSIIRHEIAENNPFAEPAPVFSNIKNGLGCFGASNRTVLKLKL